MPKVLIDITDEQYKDLIRLIKKCADAEEMVLTSTEMYNVAGLFLTAIEQGVKLDNLTNGEVIKKMFPHYDIEIDEHKGYVRVFYENFYTTYPLTWWNGKWGE